MCVRLLWLCGLDVASDPLIVRGVHRFLDNGSDQGTAWTAAAFDDSAWASGVGQVRVVLRLRRSASAENPQIRGGRIPSADFEIVATEPLRQFSADAPRSPPSPPSRHIPSTVPLAFTAMVHVW